MEAKTHKTAVVIIPPGQVCAPIEVLRERHDRQFRRWMPHITLLYPFRPVAQFEGLAPCLAEACKGVEPFELELTAFRFFEHSRRSCTLWLEPIPGDPVVELQEALWRRFPECDEVRRFAGGYVPHLSVGQARGRGAAQGLIAEWKRQWRPVRFPVVEICLIWRNEPPDDRFRVAARIPLGRESSGW